MPQYRMKTGKVGAALAGAYKKIEGAFVDTFLETDTAAGGALKMKGGKVGRAVQGAYQKIESAVVGGYQRIEDKFVDAFLEKAETGQAAQGRQDAPLK